MCERARRRTTADDGGRRPAGCKQENKNPTVMWGKTHSSDAGGGAVGVLAGCVGCSCVLLRLLGLSPSLPKVASHGGDVGDDSWLKW